MRAIFSIVVLLLVLCAAAVADDTPHLGSIAFIAEDGSETKNVFSPNTPRIILHVEILGVTAYTKVQADWIAVKTGVAPANFKIDAAQTFFDDDADSDTENFTLSKPNGGWPVGDYKVELSIDGKIVKSMPFSVAK